MVVESIVVKIASRCNLNCSYCYVYNLGDTSYQKQPKLMTHATVDVLIQRVLEHCKANKLKKFSFILHGGEPLLHQKSFFTYFVNSANKILKEKNNIYCKFLMQTNGVLITEEWCKLFKDLKIYIGISLDGDKEVNDKYRVDHRGKGSYDYVIKGLTIAQEQLDYSPGILSVIDIEANPLKTYNHLKKLDISFVDLLWPHATHDMPPNLGSLEKGTINETVYADWLITIFDLWYLEKVNNKLKIRLFDTLINLIIGNKNSGNEDFGENENGVLVVETNGDIKVVGSLNICGNGFTKNGANISSSSFSEALETKLAKVYYKSHKMLNKKCLSCPLVEVCGGGHIHTRFSKQKGFDDVSVYCQDYMKLITHIQNTVYDSLPKKYQKDFDKISYHEVKSYMSKLGVEQIKTPQYTQELNSFNEI